MKRLDKEQIEEFIAIHGKSKWFDHPYCNSHPDHCLVEDLIHLFEKLQNHLLEINNITID